MKKQSDCACSTDLHLKMRSSIASGILPAFPSKNSGKNCMLNVCRYFSACLNSSRRQLRLLIISSKQNEVMCMPCGLRMLVWGRWSCSDEGEISQWPGFLLFRWQPFSPGSFWTSHGECQANRCDNVLLSVSSWGPWRVSLSAPFCCTAGGC